jgi:hypothetical protein
MHGDGETKRLEDQLDAILDALRKATGASRCTLRMDDEARGWHVDYVVAESLAPKVRSLRGNGAIDQRAAATVQWIEAKRRNLIQSNLMDAPDPAPPPALIDTYGATAQMLSPIFDSKGALAGWISVHYTGGPRVIREADEAALNAANRAVTELLGTPRTS